MKDGLASATPVSKLHLNKELLGAPSLQALLSETQDPAKTVLAPQQVLDPEQSSSDKQAPIKKFKLLPLILSLSTLTGPEIDSAGTKL